jgi:MoaA/NifB/PqqE/SkfB family radical SAM enzyme
VDRLLEVLGGGGFRLTVMTAGTGLDRHADSVARWCDSVVVSLDGPPEIHDAIRRVPGTFSELAKGVEALRERAGTTIGITARCTVQRDNIGHLAATVATARELGLDGISLLPVDVTSAAFGRTGSRNEERLRRQLAPDAGDLDGLAAELEAVARGAGSGGVPGFVAEDREALMVRVLGHFRAEAGVTEHRARACNAPWVSAVVETDGTVRPCFFHPPSGRLGRDDDLGTVLNARRALEQRQRLDVATDPTCRRCVCPLALREGEDPV